MIFSSTIWSAPLNSTNETVTPLFDSSSSSSIIQDKSESHTRPPPPPPPRPPPPRPPPPHGPSDGYSSGGSSASATATAVAYCFSDDMLVTLTTGQRIPIGKLRAGDKLLTIDGSKIITSEMVMMLDKHASIEGIFYTITTMSGHNISLTDVHLIPIITVDGLLNYVPVRDIKKGDILYVVSNGTLIQSPVINVKLEVKVGYFSPLTTAGTLLVNDILVSCYANVKSHDNAHFYMAPFRWYYQLFRSLSITEPFGSHATDGVHIIPLSMYNFARWFRPSTLLH
ncbi:unnamed protein product [Rotaria sp. Silwood1]|nr:unnamed protein product [Rotaria sp. Silwood1]